MLRVILTNYSLSIAFLIFEGEMLSNSRKLPLCTCTFGDKSHMHRCNLAIYSGQVTTVYMYFWG